MKPFDLVFIAAFSLLVGAVIWIAVCWARGRRAKAVRNLRRVAYGAGAYLIVEIAVSLATPQHIVSLGDTRRFDDWCIAATAVDSADHIDATSARPDRFVILTLRVFSEARRVSQAAPQASVYLVDAAGTRHDVDASGQRAYERLHGRQAGLGTRLGPLASVTTIRVFRVPVNVAYVDVVTPHGGGPGLFIIGDDNSLFHKPTVIRVPLSAVVGARSRPDAGTVARPATAALPR